MLWLFEWNVGRWKEKMPKCMLVYPRVFFLGGKNERPFKCNKIILQHIIAASAFGTKCVSECPSSFICSYMCENCVAPFNMSTKFEIGDFGGSWAGFLHGGLPEPAIGVKLLFLCKFSVPVAALQPTGVAPYSKAVGGGAQTPMLPTSWRLLSLDSL